MNERIKALRLALGLSQEEFGRRLGVGRGAITNIEHNKVEPKPLFVDLICREFRADRKWLESGEGEMFCQLTEDEELELIFDQIHFSGDPTIKSIIKAYWSMPDDAKAVFRSFVDAISKEYKKTNAEIKKTGDKIPGEK